MELSNESWVRSEACKSLLLLSRFPDTEYSERDIRQQTVAAKLRQYNWTLHLQVFVAMSRITLWPFPVIPIFVKGGWVGVRTLLYRILHDISNTLFSKISPVSIVLFLSYNIQLSKCTNQHNVQLTALYKCNWSHTRATYLPLSVDSASLQSQFPSSQP
jgi:hypothetical protein